MAAGGGMTNVWAQLLPTALVGTERQPFTAPSVEGGIGTLIADIASEDSSNAQKVLRIAGVLSVCANAGATAAATTIAFPAAALPETRATITDPTTIALFNWALGEGPDRLQHELLVKLAAAGLHLPYVCLPGAMAAAQRRTHLRAALQGAVGERGRWLAKQNDAWQFATGLSETADVAAQWAEGNLEQRVALLKAERADKPEAARDRLEKALPELPARERAELVQVLGVNLSSADESLLNKLLIDRSRDVRQLVIMLFTRLPDSAHTVRAIARLAPLLQQERAFLSKRWAITTPGAASDDWKHDGIEQERPKNETLGEQAWWLYQLTRQVPLEWWAGITGMNAKDLVKWALASDWAEALVRAWRDVLMTNVDVEWCEALLDQWPQKILRDGPAALLAKMPFAKRERYLQHALDYRAASISLSTAISQVIAACPMGEQFSEAFSDAMVKTSLLALRDVKHQSDYWLRGQLPELFCAVNPGALPSTNDVIATPDDTTGTTETLYIIEKIIRTRNAICALSAGGTGENS
jgi:Family of unknown function (DUF5691)